MRWASLRLIILVFSISWFFPSDLSIAAEKEDQLKAEDTEDYKIARQNMVQQQLRKYFITDPRVLEAMSIVPRHLFVPKELAMYAYEDSPLSINYEQTISQPFIVAYMSQAVYVSPQDRVLEIGTGSGYQAAILGELAAEVFSVEVIEPLGLQAEKLLKQLGYENVTVKISDGSLGWQEHAPYDVIVVTAAAAEIPAPLLEQLKPNGRLIMPVGDSYSQTLKRVTKLDSDFFYEDLIDVRFVPLT